MKAKALVKAIDGLKIVGRSYVPKGTIMRTIQIKRKRNNNNANIRYLHWVDYVPSYNLVGTRGRGLHVLEVCTNLPT